MVVERTEIEVTVTRLKVRLLKVAWPNGHQIVVGGRLVSSSKDGVVSAHPDMPAYTAGMFPGDVDAWSDGQLPEIRVSLHTQHGMRELGVVRACTLLFTERDRKTVASWLRSQA